MNAELAPHPFVPTPPSPNQQPVSRHIWQRFLKPSPSSTPANCAVGVCSLTPSTCPHDSETSPSRILIGAFHRSMPSHVGARPQFAESLPPFPLKPRVTWLASVEAGPPILGALSMVVVSAVIGGPTRWTPYPASGSFNKIRSLSDTSAAAHDFATRRPPHGRD
jgi:hypothetical protein